MTRIVGVEGEGLRCRSLLLGTRGEENEGDGSRTSWQLSKDVRTVGALRRSFQSVLIRLWDDRWTSDTGLERPAQDG